MNCNPSDWAYVLRTHGSRYPAMEAADYVKLAFQSEFAGGHMIRDRAACLAFLLAEWDAVAPDPAGILWEDVGGGLMRLHLSPAKAKGLSPEAICGAFMQTANGNRGTSSGLQKKLDRIQALAKERAIPVAWEPLCTYLMDYRRQGCPPVHHSAAYAAAYSPHYRVVDPTFFSAG